jgi:hypothetical protein
VCVSWEGLGVEGEQNSNLRFGLNEYPDTHLSLSCHRTLICPHCSSGSPNACIARTNASYLQGKFHLKMLRIVFFLFIERPPIRDKSVPVTTISWSLSPR